MADFLNIKLTEAEIDLIRDALHAFEPQGTGWEPADLNEPAMMTGGTMLCPKLQPNLSMSAVMLSILICSWTRLTSLPSMTKIKVPRMRRSADKSKMSA